MSPWQRGYEIAAGNPYGLEYGAGGGFVTIVDSKSVERSADEDDWGYRKHNLQGYAVRWRSVIEQRGKYFYFLPGSIPTPMLGGTKRLIYDHNDAGETIATTDDGLILHSDQHGLAMRLILKDTPGHRKAYEFVRDGHRTALSIGALMHGDEYREADGVMVKIVRSATLQEISLVTAGACRPAYCAVVKSGGTSLAEDGRRHKIVSDGAAQRFEKALKGLHESLRQERR